MNTKASLPVFAAVGLAIGVSGCGSNDVSSFYGVCTADAVDGSAACSGTTHIDYGTTTPDVIPPEADTPQKTCEDAGNVWSAHCETQVACALTSTTGGVTTTTETGSTADDTITASETDLKLFVCNAATACDALYTGTSTTVFTNNTTVKLVSCE